jgi:hypothetical protein
MKSSAIAQSRWANGARFCQIEHFFTRSESSCFVAWKVGLRLIVGQCFAIRTGDRWA